MTITLTGSNDFARDLELNRLISEFLSNYDELGLERLDGGETTIERINELLQSLPFLVARKLVILKNPSLNKQFLEEAEDLLNDLPESTDLIIVEVKLDKRLSYYKLLKNKTDYKEFNDLDAASLAQWTVGFAKSKDGDLSLNDARFLIERVGLNQQILASEVEKLILYEPRISRQTITLLTEPTPQSSIFELLDAAFSGNSKKAVELYAEQRALKVEPQQIIAMLAWQFHILALIKTAGNRSPEDIAKQARIHPYVVRKSLNIANRLSLPTLKTLVGNLLRLDVRLKSESINSDDALQFFLLTLTNR